MRNLAKFRKHLLAPEEAPTIRNLAKFKKHLFAVEGAHKIWISPLFKRLVR